jgi:phosphatidylserine/phosphatidylglycerophosphate/cardiolipin synthase-like enzyme
MARASGAAPTQAKADALPQQMENRHLPENPIPFVASKARIVLPLLVALAGALVSLTCYARPGAHSAQLTRAAEAGSSSAEQHFSPSENLEQFDRDCLEQAQHSVDIAMYAFTDRYLADQLLKLASRGVRIRLYRDRQQYEEEQNNARERNRPSATDLLRGQRNIEVRIKASHELMHLKAYLVDGRLLRDGSANWSAAGLKRQDNNLHFTADPAQVRAFQQQFEQMWNRPDNERVR